MTSCMAEGIELGFGVRQEGRWAIKLYDAAFIQEHHLRIPLN